MATFQNITTLAKKYYKSKYGKPKNTGNLKPDFENASWKHEAEIRNIRKVHSYLHESITTEKEYLQVDTKIRHGIQLEGCNENVFVKLTIPPQVCESRLGPGLPNTVDIPMDLDHTLVHDIGLASIQSGRGERLTMVKTEYTAKLLVRTIFDGKMFYKIQNQNGEWQKCVELDDIYMKDIIAHFSQPDQEGKPYNNQCLRNGDFVTIARCTFILQQAKANRYLSHFFFFLFEILIHMFIMYVSIRTIYFSSSTFSNENRFYALLFFNNPISWVINE